MDSYSTQYRDNISSVNFAIDVSRGAEFWAQISQRRSLWLPMGKTSGITKSLCINIILSIPTPLHIGTVDLVSYLA